MYDFPKLLLAHQLRPYFVTHLDNWAFTETLIGCKGHIDVLACTFIKYFRVDI